MEQTDRSQRGGSRGLEEIRQRTYMHICKVHGHRQRCGEGRGRGSSLWRRENGRHL